MNYQKTDLTNRLSEYLDRRSVPMNLAGKPQAQAAELDALLRVILRSAPRENHVEWWNKITDQLDLNAKTRGWPTVFEINHAVKAIGAPKSVRPAEGDEVDRDKIMAERMNEGQAVGDECFYGAIAVRLRSRGLVSEETMRQYRSAWYFAAKKVHKDSDKLASLEAGMKRRHVSAEKLSQSQKSDAPFPEIPVKTIKTYEWDGEDAR